MGDPLISSPGLATPLNAAFRIGRGIGSLIAHGLISPIYRALTQAKPLIEPMPGVRPPGLIPKKIPNPPQEQNLNRAKPCTLPYFS